MKVYRKNTGQVMVELGTMWEALMIKNIIESLRDNTFIPRRQGKSAARTFLDENRHSVEEIGSNLYGGLMDILEEKNLPEKGE